MYIDGHYFFRCCWVQIVWINIYNFMKHPT
jgi:hypothetical protein